MKSPAAPETAGPTAAIRIVQRLSGAAGSLQWPDRRDSIQSATSCSQPATANPIGAAQAFPSNRFKKPANMSSPSPA